MRKSGVEGGGGNRGVTETTKRIGCIITGTLDCRYDLLMFFFFSSRRRHTRLQGDWSSDVCSSDLSRAAAWQIAWLASWRGALTSLSQSWRGTATSYRIVLCEGPKNVRLLRGNVSSSRPSERGDNWCRLSQDGDGLKYDVRSKSARCEPAWRLPSVATRHVGVEYDTGSKARCPSA